jgi:RNA polymerase sigma factor (TIGR02999 family)
MSAPSSQEITQLLLAWGDGDSEALEKLTPLVYSELHRLARHYMRGERAGHTLQTTELINEAFLKLIDCSKVRWQNRAHFIAVAARLMRRILVDFARNRNYLKRGGGAIRVSLGEAKELADERSADFEALDNALIALAAIDARKSQIVELRFFGGLSVEETAEVIGVSVRTVMREWSLAQAWLYRQLSGEKNDES